MHIKEDESPGTGSGGGRVAAASVDRCTGSVGARTTAAGRRREQRRMIDRWGQMFDSWGHPGA